MRILLHNGSRLLLDSDGSSRVTSSTNSVPPAVASIALPITAHITNDYRFNQPVNHPDTPSLDRRHIPGETVKIPARNRTLPRGHYYSAYRIRLLFYIAPTFAFRSTALHHASRTVPLKEAERNRSKGPVFLNLGETTAHLRPRTSPPRPPPSFSTTFRSFATIKSHFITYSLAILSP
jgi:hypothetical protein